MMTVFMIIMWAFLVEEGEHIFFVIVMRELNLTESKNGDYFFLTFIGVVFGNEEYKEYEFTQNYNSV